jgi:hypothetical protein
MPRCLRAPAGLTMKNQTRLRRRGSPRVDTHAMRTPQLLSPLFNRF